jgi:hypothetical protein
MLSLAIQSVMSWLGVFAPILIPGGLILAVWISLSHRGEFTLTWSEKLLRMMMFLGVLVRLAILIFFVSQLGHDPYGWDQTTM